MANKSKAETTPAMEPETETKAVSTESVYTREELVNNYKTFGTFREIVDVALRLAGKDAATFTEAKDIIEKYKNKEVK